MSREALPRELRLADALFPGPDWKKGHVDEGGQFHLVLVAPGEAVMRMSRTPGAARDMQRSVDLVEALSGRFSFLLPTALSEVWHGEGFSAVIQRYVPGAAHPPHTGDPAALRAVLEELAAVDPRPIAHLLAPPFSFRGPWTGAKADATLAALPADLAGAAALVLEAIKAFASAPVSLVHGDLAGHNMRWSGGTLRGIIDWDLASAWDPALNTAYLSMWHGADVIDAIAPNPQESWRARIWLGAMALESVYDASLNPGRDLAPLVEKVGPRLLAAAAAAG
ncbi:hypothetical protein GCM10009715_23530 [Paeniglutamicibacter psychrophenolicus]|uniref:Aminoglycoside phosphotransferase (APT) family kinase protein n=1 Tax=Paeniglutamicibacter psychrophenolicus TaxID=257454 RepID=A0ABS4WHU4_9MICC|nr:phosphotransferase [Paeniglutamicibacter psychrophenolicus]MBP2375784.1 aminoglycoside phosphotransferase (APT) family kinase protein [Paeniglutamicibacter psychrophenolicus]